MIGMAISPVVYAEIDLPSYVSIKAGPPEDLILKSGTACREKSVDRFAWAIGPQDRIETWRKAWDSAIADIDKNGGVPE